MSLASLTPLSAPRDSADLPRFEEELISHLSRLMRALEADASSVAAKLDSLERAVARGESAAGDVVSRVKELQRQGRVCWLPLEAVTVSAQSERSNAASALEQQHGEARGIPALPHHRSSSHRVLEGARNLAGTNAETSHEEASGRLSEEDLESIRLGLQNLRGKYRPAPPAATWCATSTQSFAGPSSKDDIAAEEAGSARGSSLLPSNGASAPSPVHLGTAQALPQFGQWPGPGNLEASPGFLRPTASVGQAQGDDFSSWPTGGMPGAAAAGVVDDSSEDVQQGVDFVPLWGGVDALEPSASAVRGFRALLEAALRAPADLTDAGLPLEDEDSAKEQDKAPS